LGKNVPPKYFKNTVVENYAKESIFKKIGMFNLQKTSHPVWKTMQLFQNFQVLPNIIK